MDDGATRCETRERDELLAFELALDERVADEVHRLPWGRLFLTPSAPLIWDSNWVAIEQVGLSVDQLVAIADDALGGEGFGHRTIGFVDQADGRRVREKVEARHGALAALGGRADPVHGLARRRGRGPSSRPGGTAGGDRGAAQGADRRVDAHRRWRRGGGRSALRARSSLRRGGRRPLVRRPRRRRADVGLPTPPGRHGIGQVEEVGTLTAARERGHAKAIVLAAIAAAQAAGDKTIFLTAEAADWPQLFYARLGFETVGEITVLRRRPA